MDGSVGGITQNSSAEAARDNPYKVTEETAEEIAERTRVINRRYTREEEDLFHKALADSYKVPTSTIKVEIEGNYKLYRINGKVIFRDFC
jgi:hypothetical protein